MGRIANLYGLAAIGVIFAVVVIFGHDAFRPPLKARFLDLQRE